jgi:glycosyltransferase involved in cell wall biosynthesis
MKAIQINENLLLFGCDFFPQKKASEINFWNDMIENLSRSFGEIVVISVNNRSIKREKLKDNIYLYNVKPHYFGKYDNRDDHEYSGKSFHRLPLSVAFKTYSFLRYQKLFQYCIEYHNIGIVHYMRVFGLLNKILIDRYPDLLFTITVPTHVDRGFPLHYFYHFVKNMALKQMDKIICTSHATNKRLEKLGIERQKLDVIPWSVGSSSFVKTRLDPNYIKTKYNIDPLDRIILWSGPLQDTGSKEFFYAYNIARKVCETSDQHTFIFAFKRGKKFVDYSNTSVGYSKIKIMESTRDEFLLLRDIADIFLSPICSKNRTVAPPLTWIEMMGSGIPIITTSVDGVDDIISHHYNGFLVDKAEDTVELLFQLKDVDFLQVCRNAQKTVKDEYHIEEISARYVDLWQTTLAEKRSTDI